ncbi:MAG: dethiobiotin synthase [Bacteroidetes bacterium]|nr:dethiobiotin synthase [Bacteroidota bacterium]
MYQPIWVTGTDTGVGKTVFSALITKALNAVYWKPVQSGLDEGKTDTERVKFLTGLSDRHFLKERWLLTQPFSPHLAAKLDGVQISLDDFSWPDSSQVLSRYLVIEGAGGVNVPLNHKTLLIELMAKLRAPVIVVCRPTLGTINHSLLTIQTLQKNQISVLGCVFSGEPNAENEKAVVSFSGVPLLGRIPKLNGDVTPDVLMSVWHSQGFENNISVALNKL